MQKSHLSLNQRNQLLIKPTKSQTPLTVDGKLSLTKNNNLMFSLDAPARWRRIHNLPPKIEFKGKWRLSPDYDLEFHLGQAPHQFKRDCLSLRGKIINGDRDNLTFQVKGYEGRGISRVRFLKLSGVWCADKFNRINFRVSRNQDSDVIVFKDAWRLNKQQQIVYEYRKAALKSMTSSKSSLTFTGVWQISSNKRLKYILFGDSHSRFDFRVQLQTPNLYPKKGAVKFRIGVGVKKDKLRFRQQTIPIYGAWKFSRRLGVYFESDYSKGRIVRTYFDAEVNLSKKDKIIFRLRDKQGKSLGITVVFKHNFLSRTDIKWLLGLQINNRQKKIEARVCIPF